MKVDGCIKIFYDISTRNTLGVKEENHDSTNTFLFHKAIVEETNMGYPPNHHHQKDSTGYYQKPS